MNLQALANKVARMVCAMMVEANSTRNPLHLRRNEIATDVM